MRFCMLADTDLESGDFNLIPIENIG